MLFKVHFSFITPNKMFLFLPFCCKSDIRLVNGTGDCNGKVEIYQDGQWGTVCDDGWDINDAEVVCRQMGCGRAVSIHSSAHFGQGTGPILLDNVHCVGSERSITECRHNGFGRTNCHHGEDAGVTCSYGMWQSSQHHS
uniref:SRCR domain-containing protein n=1 Tax=Astyanax mexicanus TaxID=7994 RepID=A0A3B1IDN3_ASTMX